MVYMLSAEIAIFLVVCNIHINTLKYKEIYQIKRYWSEYCLTIMRLPTRLNKSGHKLLFFHKNLNNK